jgi:hypothetical protein
MCKNDNFRRLQAAKKKFQVFEYSLNSGPMKKCAG